MLVSDPAHHEPSWLTNGSGGDFDQHVIEPQQLGRHKIDAMLSGIGSALIGVEGKLHTTRFHA